MRDPRIDDYIGRAQPFAQPILRHIRTIFHEAIPGAEETLKWGKPHFTHGGKNLGGIAAFNAHVALMIANAGRVGEGLGGYGKIAALEDLPPKEELLGQIRAAAALIDAGEKRAWSKQAPAREAIAMPQDFAAALRDAPQASAIFDGFTPAQQRDYLEWITGAKQDKTRSARLATAIEWLGEGKRRNWKYERQA